MIGVFKTAASLEETGRIQIVALDKTGTVTSGEPTVTDICPVPGVTEAELLGAACALEQKSEHPLAKAVLRRAQADGLTAAEVTAFQALPGSGLQAVLDGQTLCGGNADFIRTAAALPDVVSVRAEQLAEEGKTPLFFARGGKLLGVIAVADVLKPDSPQAIRALQNMGIRVVMLTGDNARTAKAIGAQTGVDEVIAGVLPDGKEREIRRLSARGKVAMVGDGINDAPALTRADVGIAIGAGTDVAIDAADVVLVNSRLSDVPAAIRLSRATLRNIHENLFWAFFYNTIGIPIAAGVFVPLGLTLSPMLGAAAMSLSSFCVVTNALRLNLFDLHDARRDHKRASHLKEVPEIKEETTMKKTISIEGMMCGHCEATVKKALEALPEVTEAAVSHTAGTAVVTLSAPVDDAALKAAHGKFCNVTYEVTGDIPSDAGAAPASAKVKMGGSYTVAPAQTTSQSRYTFSGWRINGTGDIVTSLENLQQDVKLVGVWSYRSGGSSGGGGGRKPTVDIPDDVPTGLNGDDHYAYIVGYQNGNVEPNGNITRAEVATIFFRLLTEEVRTANSTQSNSLSDVTRGQWFNHAVSTLSSMGIVKGHNDGTDWSDYRYRSKHVL